MITYEVTAVVDGALVPEFESFMRSRHIPDLLATGCFVAASFSRADANRYRMRYEAPDEAAVARYVSEHGPRLRADVQERFPEGVQFSRETWTVLERWPSGTSDR